MSRILLPFIVAAAVLEGCANGETADSGVATDNCLYIVKYEGRMMKAFMR